MPNYTEQELQAKCAEVGRILKKEMPQGVGFVAAVFEYGGPGNWLSYLSTAKREDTLRVLRELITVIESHTN